MRAIDIYDRLRAMDHGWVDWNNTVDTFKAGDPQAEVTGVAVGWMGYTWALQRAVELGCNVFVTHEPTYYNHWDTDEAVFEWAPVAEKRRWIEDSGIVVMRCHDVWDQVKDIGIPDSWARMLALGEPVAGDGYYRVYDVSGHTGRSLARQIATHTQRLGQPGVQLVGPPDKAVTRVAIGTGAITPFVELVQTYGVDMVICSDDGFVMWRDGALAIDIGLPVVVVNHPVSEIHGIERLAEHLRAALPEVPVHYVAQGCMFEVVGG